MGEKMISPASPSHLNLSGSPQVEATWNTCGSEINIFCRDLELHLMLLKLVRKVSERLEKYSKNFRNYLLGN